MCMKAFISTYPFGTVSEEPLQLLQSAGIEYGINPHQRSMTSVELAACIGEVDYLLAGVEMITPAVLDQAKNLKCIVRVGAGLDNIPFDELKKRAIKIASTPEATTRAVAECAMGLIFDCLRQFTRIDRDLRQGVWNKHMGSLLEGKTIGIVGLGRIGKTLVQFLGVFGVHILAYDVFQDSTFAQEHAIAYHELPTVLAQSDIVVLSLAYTSAVHHLMNADTLALMKSSASLINVARGALVDESALSDALTQGRLASAALDVFEKEPYAGPLCTLPNVTLTAHIGAATRESRRLMEVSAVEELLRFHRGEPLRFAAEH